jgi:amidase
MRTETSFRVSLRDLSSKTFRSAVLALGLITSAYAAEKKFEVVETTVADIHAAMKAHTLTAHQLVQLYLDRIAAYDQKGPTINCVISLNPLALEEADKLDAAFAKSGFVGPLHGIPILVKDEIDAAGMATTLGTKEFKDYRPPLDAFAVAQLKKAGAIILGKATLSEFAGGDAYGSMFGESHNPYDLTRTVGGSSGGSGGALAANFSTLTVGEETGSSLRRPAAWGSLVGMRPTPGLISRTGMWDGHPIPTAQIGPMARTVTDMAKMLDAMVGYDPEDPITALGIMHTPKTYTAYLDKNALKGARIGVIREPLSPNSDPEAADFKRVDALFIKALDELRAAGATVMDVTIPNLKELMSKRADDPALHDEALHVYLSRNPNSEFKTREDIDNHPEMAKSFKAKSGQRGGRGGAGERASDPAKILESKQAREQLMLNIAKVMADNHLDTLAYKATEHEPMLIADAVNPPYKPTKGVVSLNTFLIHASTITVPMGFTNDNTLPAGLAFLGLPYSEPTLIKLAYAYEQATHHRMPPKSTPPLLAVIPAK